jgi:hypothetical protein
MPKAVETLTTAERALLSTPAVMLTPQPSPPAAEPGFLKLYGRNRAGRFLPEMVGPSGLDTPLQPSLVKNNFLFYSPNTAAVGGGTGFGSTWTNTGTPSHPTQAATSVYAAMIRTLLASATTAGATAGIAPTGRTFFRGAQDGVGGWFFTCRFGLGTNLDGHQAFVGLSAATLAGEPSAMTNAIGIGFDSTDLTTDVWSLITNDGTGAATKTPIAGFVRQQTTVIDIEIFARPNGDRVGIRVVEVDGTGVPAVRVDNLEVTADLPVATTALIPRAVVRNGATVISASIAINRMGVESDY